MAGDWTAASPALGSFSTLDTSAAAHKDVVSVTRSGTLAVYATPASACSPSSSPRFHHDDSNSGDYTRDAVPPGVPMAGRVTAGQLSLVAPGGDLLCGTASRYQLVTSRRPVTAESFSRAQALRIDLAPASAGSLQHLRLPRGTLRYIAIRALDAAGNVGRPLVLRAER